MITVEETNRCRRIAEKWFYDECKPAMSEEEFYEWCSIFYPSIEAREFEYFLDGEFVAHQSFSTGLSLHYKYVVDSYNFISPDARNNRALLKAMLEQSKQVCREAGIQWLVRSTHISPSVEKVSTTFIPEVN